MAFFCCGITVAAQAVSEPKENSTLADWPFVVVTPADSAITNLTFTDQEFYQVSASVIFKVNRTEISKDDSFLELYRSRILPLISEQHLQLRKVYIRGAASPEGPYANNRYLGRARTKALLEEIREGLVDQYLESEFELSSVVEDYRYLCVLMDERGDADAAFVRELCEKAKWNELACKKSLMKAWGGRIWKRLLKEYFPELRAARVILWFSECDEEHLSAFLPPREETPAAIPTPPSFALAQHLELPQLPLVRKFFPEHISERTDSLKPRRHLIALRTNLVHDLFYMPKIGWTPSPNLQLEYYPLDGHWTANLGATWGTRRLWDRQQFFQVRDFQLEARRYFKGHGQFTGLYMGGFAHADVYGIGLNAKKGWQGEGGGAGLSVGYVLPLNRKGSFRLEFMLAAGMFFSRFDPYVYGNPVTGDIDGDYYYDYVGNASDFKKRNYQLTWFGPTNLGIQLTYDIIYRKRQK